MGFDILNYKEKLDYHNIALANRTAETNCEKGREKS